MLCLRRLGFLNFKHFTRHLSSQKEKNVVVNVIENVTTIGLNNPSKRNCLSLDTIEQLKRAFDDFDQSDSSVAVLHGEGGNFCSGFDLDEISKVGIEPFKSAVTDWVSKPLSKKTVICAVNGFCVAEGFELALACDLRVIEDTASMGFLGRRYGIPLSIGGSQRVLSSLGRSRALDLIITGRLINGLTANDWGLAARSVATGTAVGQSVNLGFSISKLPIHSIELDRYNTSDEFSNFYDKKYISELESLVLSEMSENVSKFYKGIGKHGKFKNLTKKSLLHWETIQIVDATKV